MQRQKKGQNPVAQWVISIISVLEATQILSLLLTYHQPIHPALKKGGSEKKYADPASLVCSLVQNYAYTIMNSIAVISLLIHVQVVIFTT